MEEHAMKPLKDLMILEVTLDMKEWTNLEKGLMELYTNLETKKPMK